ncbi:MAG: DUF1566 domain-containing protein [Dysgonamonadaceae bacterium]|jgi:hypothetical protein|nr:DUF1566 domain-containing protein [Dysgonamonadaceae bacterium]
MKIVNNKRFFLVFLFLPAVYLASGQVPGMPYGVPDCSPVQPGTITINPTSVELGQSFTATINAVPDATSYTWTLPGGLTAGSLTTTAPGITITGASAGTYPAGSIKVKANNACGSSADQSSADAVTVNAFSCPGYVCVGCAFDYSANHGSVPGDASKGQTLTGANTDEDDTRFPNLDDTALGNQGYTSTDATSGKLSVAFTSANKDLCVYKVDVSGTKEWWAAVNACNVTYDGFSGWYLPNLRELHAIYEAFGGDGGRVSGSADMFGEGGVPMSAELYWSSTEHSRANGYFFYFYDGSRFRNSKTTRYFARCVRRM